MRGEEVEAAGWRQVYYVFYDCFEQCCWRSADIKDCHCVWLWPPQRWFISQMLKEIQSLTSLAAAQTIGRHFVLAISCGILSRGSIIDLQREIM